MDGLYDDYYAELEFANGDILKGTFSKGNFDQTYPYAEYVFSGGKGSWKGKIKIKNNSTYYLSEGEATLQNGIVLKGKFDDNGYLQGNGEQTGNTSNCKGCDKYVGNFTQGKRSGFGKCYTNYANGYGLIYEGQFYDDRPTELYPNRLGW